MTEHELNDLPTAKAISPKVTWPVILQIIALAATTASTQDWSETQWIQSAIIVISAVAGWWVNDPARVTQ